jgi:hypothetical protein
MDSDSPRNSNSSDSGRRVTSILSRREPSSSLYLLPPAVPESLNRDIDPFCFPFNIAVTRFLSYSLLVVSFRYRQRGLDVSSLSQTVLQVMEGK